MHGFADLPHRKGEYVITEEFVAHGHKWTFAVFPRGDDQSPNDPEHVACGLGYEGGTASVFDPVLAKVSFRTKSRSFQLLGGQSYPDTESGDWILGYGDISERDEIIRRDLDEKGTLTIYVDIEVATKPHSTWRPPRTDEEPGLVEMHESAKETGDVAFVVGERRRNGSSNNKTELLFKAHACVLAVRAPGLHEILMLHHRHHHHHDRDDNDHGDGENNNNCDNGEGDCDNGENNITVVPLPNEDPIIFGMMLDFIYTKPVDPAIADYVDNNAEKIVVVANRFGIVGLKLRAESALAETLNAFNACRLLSLADANSLPLLKEAAMELFVRDAKAILDASKAKKEAAAAMAAIAKEGSSSSSSDGFDFDENENDDWKKYLEGSPRLLSELYTYQNIQRADENYATVGALRTQLLEAGRPLEDLDGTREMLLRRLEDAKKNNDIAARKQEGQRLPVLQSVSSRMA